jgi:hypothetical protein
MAFVLRSSILRKILIPASVLASAWVQTPVALAQHGGGHMGGGGHFGGGGMHASAPHAAGVSHSSQVPMWRPGGRVGPPPAGAGVRPFRFPQRSMYPHRYPYRYPFYFRRPFYGFGFGFNSYWWPNCTPYWSWGFNCYGVPSYGYGFGYGPGYGYGFGSYVPAPTYGYPAYGYDGEGRELAQLYLKDGTVYDVTDYWLVDNQIHFTTPEEGRRPVEQVINFDELDLQRTIDVNTERGFRFMLRNEPVEQYLQDHPDLAPPVGPPPQGK